MSSLRRENDPHSGLTPRLKETARDALDPERRRVLTELAAAAGATVLVPWITACAPEPPLRRPASRRGAGTAPRHASHSTSRGSTGGAAQSALAVPLRPPVGWDDMAFNLRRGESGAIPPAYLAKIKAPGGDKKHLGKHLPYLPKLANGRVLTGYLAVMFGEERRGFARHPNSPRDPAHNDIGHWFNWIQARKATTGRAEELRSTYPAWPGTNFQKPLYTVFGGGDIRADGGRNTIYLVRLPADVRPGDGVRIWGHCLKHGEYVDFLTA